MIKQTKLNHFLNYYNLKVIDICQISGQSPQTLRNWYNKGDVWPKSQLILCLIASIKWRKHHDQNLHYVPPFQGKRTLNAYLKSHNMSYEDLRDVCNQSNQTLNNWLKSPEKYLVIDCLIDAVCWRRYAQEKKIVKTRTGFHEIAYALQMPITLNQEETKFALSDFVKKKERCKSKRKADEINRWENGQVLDGNR